jgi:hypothetical protein
MYYKPEHFEIYELVPQDLHNKYENDLDKLWYLFDNRVLWTIDNLRKRYGKLVANDWIWDGKNQYRGWRPSDCSIGANLSQHKFGRACDVIPTETTSEEIRIDLIQNHKTLEVFKFITCIEYGVSWFHFDTRNWNKQKSGILIIRQ